MSRANAFRFLTAISAIVSAPVAFFASWLLREASNGDPRWFSEPWHVIEEGSAVASTLRVAGVAGMLGNYLLLGPLVIYLYRRLRSRGSGLARLSSSAGTLYVAIGALGSAILASSLPSLAVAWESASGADAQAIRWIFETLSRIVGGGLNGLLAMLMASVFWVGTGLLLSAKERFLGAASTIVGTVAGLAWLGALFSAPGLAELATPLYLIAAPTLTSVLGVWVWRRAADVLAQSHDDAA